ncbi:eukaryotic translation elongation factor 1 delta b (guanine nucleotide exchange protein) isoform X2 [Nematolebias whitei]|uniref:eukaryotic translation elongation factor 1 delta b (guanine nucleotide exchange protein) isoform X2 n=1 Tax=Nematolebias whitei TaxID=451745 RepID=UPI00189929CA|nr:eukaryotic translation elongation factor 1 delta b (guanine nucleotide exchange protein) isoform X2 [Nematolebias whitei]
MSKKISQFSVKDQLEHDQPPSHGQADQPAKAALGSRKKTEPGQKNGDTSSSPENGSLNGDGKRSGKSRRRRKRSSNAGSCPEGKTGEVKNEEKPDEQSRHAPDQRAVLMGLQSECGNVWFERNIYEHAENVYHCWLANKRPKQASQTNPSHQTSGKRSNTPSTVAPSSSRPACHHSDQVACHHVVQMAWINKTTFDLAECCFVEESVQQSVPKSLNLQRPSSPSTASRTPDEGYQSLAPTPATPVQQAVVTPTAQQSINGLPRIPVELLREVWLDKPRYDRAEAAFYQNLYGNNSFKRPSCPSTSRSSEHPQSLVEEEEEEEKEDDELVVEEKRMVPQIKAEIFHALHPIQEEEEPAEAPEVAEESGARFFLHPNSEPVWLDKWRYDAAESRFHGSRVDEGRTVSKNRRLEAETPPVPSVAQQRDKKMSSVDFLAQEKIWFDKPRYDDAERRFYERMNESSQSTQDAKANSILQDIARARENIQKSLAGSASSNGAADQGEIISRINSLELENQSLHKVVDNLRAALSKLECRVAVLEKTPAPVAPALSVPCTNGTTVQQKRTPLKDDDDDDDDIDLFGSDEDEEAEKLKEQRLKEYAEKKAKKPAVIAKSSILLDVKPWDDETDMAKLEECVRSVQADGLLWGTSKLVPVGYGIKKLQIACVVEDDKVGTDLLEEEITKFEDYVQSVDVAAFNKI